MIKQKAIAKLLSVIINNKYDIIIVDESFENWKTVKDTLYITHYYNIIFNYFISTKVFVADIEGSKINKIPEIIHSFHDINDIFNISDEELELLIRMS